MKVWFSSNKLQRTIENDKDRIRRFGSDMATKIQLRLDALLAAESLADFWPPSSGPERCHELRGDLAGILSMDLKQPYRLLFRPVDLQEGIDPADEKERWKAIKSVEILRIEDTHG